MKTKYTTLALKDNQHLMLKYDCSIVEVYCIGYTDGKRDKSLDGWYFKKEILTK